VLSPSSKLEKGSELATGESRRKVFLVEYRDEARGSVVVLT
jgi:hypothetical protein